MVNYVKLTKFHWGFSYVMNYTKYFFWPIVIIHFTGRGVVGKCISHMKRDGHTSEIEMACMLVILFT